MKVELPVNSKSEWFELTQAQRLNMIDEVIMKCNAPQKSKKQRKKDFYDSLRPFIDKYPKDMLREFFEYWTESGERSIRLRFEKQTTFDLSLRLQRWARNNNDKTISNERSDDTNNGTIKSAIYSKFMGLR